MKIKSIELSNFRVYSGCNKIDLSVNNEKNIIIVSGQNGYGKTTLLMALVWCLYGKNMDKVDEIYKQEFKKNGGYERYIINSLNKQARDNRITEFSVTIIFENINIPDVNCSEFKITRTYYTTGNTQEKLEILIDGCESELIEEYREDDKKELDRKNYFIQDFIMPIEIAKFFFFDAEKITSLAEVHNAEQLKSLSEAYAEVLRIKQYQILKIDLEGYKTKLKQQTATAGQKKELAKFEFELKNAETEIESSKKEISELKDIIEDLDYKVGELQKKIVLKSNALTPEKLDSLKKQRDDIEHDTEKLKIKLKEYYQKILFAIAGNLLSEVLSAVRKEKDIADNKYDQEEKTKLADDITNDFNNLIPPDDISIHYKAKNFYTSKLPELILKHLTKDLPAEEANTEMIHHFLAPEKNELEKFIQELKFSLKQEFKSIHAKYIENINEKNEISNKIRKAETQSEDASITQYRKDKDKLESQRNKKERRIGALEQTIKENEEVKIRNKKLIYSIVKKLEISKEKKPIEEAISQTIKILKNFIKDFMEEKSNSLSQRIQKQLNNLFHKEKFIDDVDVKIIPDSTGNCTIDIELKDSKSNPINKDSLSKGEQQMYATALLKSLIEEASIEFPVFIDSPMQKFDKEHSRRIVKYFYPKVSKQVVIFPLLGKEMTEDEFESLLPNISSTFLIENKSPTVSTFKQIAQKEKLFEVFNQDHQDAN